MEISWKTPCAVFTFLPFTEAATEGVLQKKKLFLKIQQYL